MQIKNLDKVAKRIKKAIKNKEKIILYGDADPDGISSLIILKESIKNLGGRISAIYFPNREIEGYGLNENALKLLERKKPALLFLLDCGIGNFKEIEKAKKMGFEVIVIDHHEILGKLPKASIIVDPKQEGDNYPFKNLATAGIVYKLAQLLLGDKFGQALKESFLELVAIATLADMMPKESENKIFIDKGLLSLERTFRPGLRAFLEKEEIEKKRDIYQKVSKIISALNSGKAKDHLNESYLLLTTADFQEAKELAETLLQRSFERKQKIEEIQEVLRKRIEKKSDPLIIFEGESSWPITLIGPVASKICQEYQKPTFIYQKGKKESVGAVRMPQLLNAVKAMESCSQYLKTFGGHPLAGGFTVSNENLEKFQECLIKYFKSNL